MKQHKTTRVRKKHKAVIASPVDGNNTCRLYTLYKAVRPFCERPYIECQVTQLQGMCDTRLKRPKMEMLPMQGLNGLEPLLGHYEFKATFFGMDQGGLKPSFLLYMSFRFSIRPNMIFLVHWVSNPGFVLLSLVTPSRPRHDSVVSRDQHILEGVDRCPY